MSSGGLGGARINQQTSKQNEFRTINKDGKSVWEPGLPSTIVSRRVHKVSKVQTTDETPISCDLRVTLKLGASAKAEWLDKAIKGIPSGRAKVQDVFNVVTHPKFVSGVPEKVGRRMLQAVVDNLDTFSDKQRVTLASKCKLAEMFRNSTAGDGSDDEDEVEAEAPEERKSRSRSRRRRRRRRSVTPEKGRVSEDPPARASRQDSSPGQEEAAESTEHALSHLSAEQRAEMDRAWEEQRKKQAEEKKKLEAEKKALKDKEDKRKAKLGAAFQLDEDDEDEAEKTRLEMMNSSKGKKESEKPPSLAVKHTPFSVPRDGQDPRFVEAMGGDRLLADAFKILQSAADTGRLGAAPPTSRSPERPPRKQRKRSPSRSRSRSRGGRAAHVRSSGSYRSPTPDGRARGQARAARKAKMIASLMGIK
eukprot:TRINITY_DN95916_c0_g1_i1.p1 TRINITY_DN95916_c0_g1~~TRINITY_DN95916_c0_g1_i1.p1  ORF type:complete len:420 (-),score=97.22 TRINITY_DN95916_c0_g1_i1:23-1282(-)